MGVRTSSRTLLGELRNLNIDYILDNSIVSMLDLGSVIRVLFLKNALVLRLMVKNLRMKYHDVCNLLSNNSA